MPVKDCLAAVLGPALLCALVSCASVKVVDLTYKPYQPGPPAAAKAGQEVVINTFKNEHVGAEIGEASNYGGHVFFTIETKSDLSAWVTQALATELGRAGYRVKLGDQVEDSGQFVINGVINQLTVHGIISNLRVTLQVAKDYKIVANGSYNADQEGYKGPFINTVYHTDYPQVYRVTLQNLMKQVVPQLIAEMDKQP